MLLWYFAHPYAACVDADPYLLCAQRIAALMAEGFIVVSPILQTHKPKNMRPVQHWTRPRWLQYTRDLLLQCDGLILAPGAMDSEGCEQEKQVAVRRDMPIREYSEMVND